MDILEKIENEFANIEQIKEKVIKPRLLQLHTGLEGFESPQAFGVYRDTGGNPLGVVGDRYRPMDLTVLLDSIVHSVSECDFDLDLSTLKYSEYKDGSKVAFQIQLPTKEIIGSPMKGDIIERRLEFRTGFDGLTKSSITEVYRRVWCDNGASSPHEMNLSFKNTLGNHIKIYNLCNFITKAIQNGDDFLVDFGRLASVKLTPTAQDEFLRKVTGQSLKDYKDISTKSRNILDAINNSVAIELQNTGDNWYSLVNGITRYLTHDRASGNEEKLLYTSANDMSQQAFKLALAQLN